MTTVSSSARHLRDPDGGPAANALGREKIGQSVKINHLRKVYNHFTAVDDLTLDIQAGEFLTILGPSGSGKTTTLMALAGFVGGFEGTISIGQQVINDLPPHRRNIGVVFQHLALFPHMTVADNIAFPLYMRGVKSAEIAEKVDRAIRLIRLDGMNDRLPSQLSGGQQQRVALARALVFSPPVLLLDEPFGALDRNLREALQTEVRALHRELGLTIILVTHDQVEAITMSDRVAVMNAGKLIQATTPTDLYFSPTDRFVAEFIGDSVFLRGRIRASENGFCRLQMSDGTLVSARCLQPLVSGAEADIMIRPEHFVIDDTNKAENTLSGTVAKLTFTGDRMKLNVALPGGEEIVVAVDNRLAIGAYAPGAAIALGWASRDAVVIES